MMQAVKRLKFSAYKGGDGLPAIYIYMEPEDNGVPELRLNVQAHQLDDVEDTVKLLEAVVDTLKSMMDGDHVVPEFEPKHVPFDPQPR
jgi:hypothetical protein